MTIMMKKRLLSTVLRSVIGIAAICIATQWSSFSVHAQKFSVKSFSELTNDISAFINPVKDRNDEGCALIKVVATSLDFAFSTPLGIVKRLDKTGEIWLYLPRGSKKITIKHPEWGVMRDFLFPAKLESHKTYDLQVEEPLLPDNFGKGEISVITVRDTLLLTKVDTVVITPRKPKISLECDALATVAYGGKGGYTAGGVMVSVMKRHGGFVHITSDFGKIGTIVATCDRYGYIDGNDRFYSGDSRRKSFMVTAGAIHRAGRNLSIFEGLGYSSCSLAWQLAQSEGGGYVRNSYFSTSGITAEAGIMLKIKRVTVSISAITVKGSDWFVSAGIGIRLGKNIN